MVNISSGRKNLSHLPTHWSMNPKARLFRLRIYLIVPNCWSANGPQLKRSPEVGLRSIMVTYIYIYAHYMLAASSWGVWGIKHHIWVNLFVHYLTCESFNVVPMVFSVGMSTAIVWAGIVRANYCDVYKPMRNSIKRSEKQHCGVA